MDKEEIERKMADARRQLDEMRRKIDKIHGAIEGSPEKAKEIFFGSELPPELKKRIKEDLDRLEEQLFKGTPPGIGKLLEAEYNKKKAAQKALQKKGTKMLGGRRGWIPM